MNYRDFPKISLSKVFCFLILFFFCSFGANALFGTLVGKKNEEQVDLTLFTEILSIVKNNYIEEVDDETLIKNAIDGMLMSLDPHSRFLDEKIFPDIQTTIKGEIGGVGIEIIPDKGFLQVISPYYDGPAFKAGIREKDYIIKVDGESIANMNSSDSVEMIRGEPGTEVTLTVYREVSRETFEVQITREIIEFDPIRAAMIDDEVLHINITRFSEGLTKRVKEVIEEANDRYDGIQGIIIDLRWNAGGIVDEAYDLSNLFLSSGTIFSIKGRHDSEQITYNADGSDIVDGMPMIVLINGGSASASEIMAAALRDNMRAILMGTKSYGKGSVQVVIPFSKKYGIKMTTALYYTPNGVAIQDSKGIIPDIEVPFGILEIAQEETQDILGIEEDEKSEEKHATSKHEVIEKSSSEIIDNQLARAIDLMKNTIIVKSLFGSSRI